MHRSRPYSWISRKARKSPSTRLAIALQPRLVKAETDSVFLRGNTTGITTLDANTGSIHISTQAGCIHVTATAKEDIKLYGADGKLLKNQNGTEAIFNVPGGLYIIKVGNVTQKVTMVK